MGNQGCCAGEKDGAATASAADLAKDEAAPVNSDLVAARSVLQSPAQDAQGGGGGASAGHTDTYRVTLRRQGQDGTKLGLDVDYMEGRVLLPIMAITGGLAEQWNRANQEDRMLRKGDSIIEVNGIRGNVGVMLDKCKQDTHLDLVLRSQITYDNLVQDIEQLISSKNCGPIMIRLSWHDAGVFTKPSATTCRANAAMRLSECTEATCPANKGLPQVAIPLLAGISKKYVPDLISHADLWALTANVAIRMMGGPDIPTRFGRVDARTAAEGADSLQGRLPDGDKGANHLREIFNKKGMDDKDIVALSGSHTVGKCSLDRSGFEGAWTEAPLKFDNAYFKELLRKNYSRETTAKGCPQHRCPISKTIMLESDLALLSDQNFKKYVEKYAHDQEAWFADFSDAWVRIQENGWQSLRDIL